MGKELPKEKQFSVKVCRERKCQDLVRDPQYPDSPQMCAVTHGMPGSMSCCVKEMDDEHFIRQISGQLNTSDFNAPKPGIRNCPEACPYKIRGMVDNGRGKLIKEGHCAFTGELLGSYGVCPCNVLGNPRQDDQIKRLQIVVDGRLRNTNPTIGLCLCGICPDGKDRGGPNTEDDRCPIIRLPYDEINIGRGCPLWRIPAKLLPVPVAIPTPSPERVKEPQNSGQLILKTIPEFKNLIPGLSPQEFRGLEESLQSEGCRDPIVTWKGIIVDGHNRYQICTSLNIPFTTIEREFTDETEVKIWIIKNQFARRGVKP